MGLRESFTNPFDGVQNPRASIGTSLGFVIPVVKCGQGRKVTLHVGRRDLG